MRRSEARQLVGAYVADRLGRECRAHGARADIARAIKFSRGHISAVINGASGVGEDFAERIAEYWGLTYDELEEEAQRWAAKNGVTIEQEKGPPPPTSWRRLRERKEWASEVAAARTRYPTVPAQFFDAVGQLFDTLPHRIDAQFIGEMARVMHDAAVREGGPESSTHNNHPPGHTRRAKH